jgi:hypothetical protein
LAVDPYGRKLASVHDESESGTVLVTMLPGYREPTLYARAGNFVAYASLAGLALLMLLGLAGRRRARRVASIALLLLTLIAATQSTEAAADRLQSFEIKDQFDVAHTEVGLADTAVIVFGSDRQGGCASRKLHRR